MGRRHPLDKVAGHAETRLKTDHELMTKGKEQNRRINKGVKKVGEGIGMMEIVGGVMQRGKPLVRTENRTDPDIKEGVREVIGQGTVREGDEMMREGDIPRRGQDTQRSPLEVEIEALTGHYIGRTFLKSLGIFMLMEK